ncbi:MAG: sigma-70 family RNA polymerase sigma factor [Sphingomonas sp.]|nr:sigma-70 family RNA polymerase sigma factor [Sphingomonas sp.]
MLRRPRTEAARPLASDERELLARVAAGDRQAFERLYRLYQPRLSRFLTTLLRRPQLIEEVLDDTMMVVWQTADRFRGSSKLSTWIFAIAYRKAHKARLRWPDPVEDPEQDSRISQDPAPDDELHHQKLHDSLIRAMDQLSADHRAVVDLTYFHGLGYREIAEIVDCPVDTVKTRMFHARRRLKQAIGGSLADWL